MLFDSFEAYDVQETRRVSRELDEERFANLTLALQKDNRSDDLFWAATDVDYRKKLYKEYLL